MAYPISRRRHPLLHLLQALRQGQWAVAAGFDGQVRTWPQALLAQLFFALTAPEQDSARRWLLEHGLSAEARLPVPSADEDDMFKQCTPPASLGIRLFDALVAHLPSAMAALHDLLHAGASPAGKGLLAQALAQLEDTPTEATRLLPWLDAGADIFGADARGRTPLHLAASLGQPRLLEVLLSRGVDPNSRDALGRTPLFAALKHDSAQALILVRHLVAYGADPEAIDGSGETPLGQALGRGELEPWLHWSQWQLPRRRLRADDLPAAAAAGAAHAVARLLEWGFPVDTRDAQGATALVRACGAGHAAMAAALLDAGADPHLVTHSGVNALAAAINRQHEAIVDLLLARGAAVDQRLPNETTGLMIAAALGYPAIVERLLHGGAAVHAVNKHGHSSLHAAAQFCFESKDSLRSRRLLEVLLKHGAKINQADQHGQTPLLVLLGSHRRPGHACDATHLGSLLPVLLAAGAHIHHADQRGVTALHACAMHALLAPARLLVAQGADRQAVDAFGRTPADVAQALGYADIAYELGCRRATIPSVRQTLRQPAR